MIVAVVIIVLFGSRKLPDAARSLGKSMRILKAEVSGLHDDDAPAANTGAGFPTQAQIQASQTQAAQTQAAQPSDQAGTQAQIDALQAQLNKLQSSVGADGTQAK
jgi:sec-independent protein translocase protein TatA